ncbi:MAG: AraC family transcriptional regulator [Gammaproteobacteria bacterium]|nr:MAG: AraC family transcriptional regulator [Gammaproteobacteria bacterium]
MQATKDPGIGLVAARFLHPTTLHALGYAWLASDCLREALERGVRYHRIVSSGIEAHLEQSAQDYRFVIHVPEVPRLADEAIDAAVAVVVNLCRASHGADFNPLRVALRRNPPADRGAFAREFRAPIEFSAPQNVIFLDKTTVETPLPTANAELARANDQVIAQYLARFERGSIKLQVEARLVEQLFSGHATQESIAKALHLSPRTLQRKLKEEGTTYKQLLDTTRRELATQYVKQTHLSVNEITFLLGFSEPANFTRAFKRWNGVSPSQYRLSA